MSLSPHLYTYSPETSDDYYRTTLYQYFMKMYWPIYSFIMFLTLIFAASTNSVTLGLANGQKKEKPKNLEKGRCACHQGDDRRCCQQSGDFPCCPRE
ncbi:hypothetical protein CROQUDRAFT_463624 [Cronartium quercuum f. sp. fusiforme G11]|uniref:Uncharacterized protein n=1 Tax=Cronartium quercuum f. sp. fusiforme G11 TaxID=708437 RepID=A0A9P6NTL7_9BASI|nr:hypothetical protein CROQUDRAFT_463624 [Cronartium quercuum f. sp. fusiforme G11]